MKIILYICDIYYINITQDYTSRILRLMMLSYFEIKLINLLDCLS